MCNCASYPIDENRPFSLGTISVSSYFFSSLLHTILIYLHRALDGKSKELVSWNRLTRHRMQMLFCHAIGSEKLIFSFERSVSLALLMCFLFSYNFCCKFMLYHIWDLLPCSQIVILLLLLQQQQQQPEVIFPSSHNRCVQQYNCCWHCFWFLPFLYCWLLVDRCVLSLLYSHFSLATISTKQNEITFRRFVDTIFSLFGLLMANIDNK